VPFRYTYVETRNVGDGIGRISDEKSFEVPLW
jgi:hypothetical protein